VRFGSDLIISRRSALIGGGGEGRSKGLGKGD